MLERYVGCNKTKSTEDWITKIYTDKKYNALTGKEAVELCKGLQTKTIASINEKDQKKFYERYKTQV